MPGLNFLQKLHRICQICDNQEQKVEDEFHFIFECKMYDNERFLWLQNLTTPTNFLTNSPEKKLDLVLNDPRNVKLTAQFLINIFDIRSKIVNSLPSTNDATSTSNLFHLLPHDQCPACNKL